jgi:hypothetical protein
VFLGPVGTFLCGQGLKKPPTGLETAANSYCKPGHTGEITNVHDMQDIKPFSGYKSHLSLQSVQGTLSGPICVNIRSDRFQRLFPEHEIKQDKDTKSNFRVQKRVLHANGITGPTFSTST